MDAAGYDTDFILWTKRQSDLLRRMAAGERVNSEVDWLNIAEEIESLGRSDRRELRNRIATILEHLIKLQASPARDPRDGWVDTIEEQRRRLRLVIDDSPSLRAAIPASIESELEPAREAVLRSLARRRETAIVDPQGLAYTQDQVLGDWLP
jgi:hypothetical protein